MSPVIPATFAEARAFLTARPVGRTPLGLRAQALRAEGAESGIDAVVTIAGDVLIGAILDLPGADIPVNAGMLQQWGVSIEQTLDAAIAGRATAGAQVQQVETAGLVMSMPFAASVLAAPSFAPSQLSGRTPVILIPTPGAIVFAASDDVEGLRTLARIADRLIENDERTVSVTPLVSTGVEWVPFEWPQEVLPAAGALYRRWVVKQFAVQRGLLAEHYARTGQDFTVAEAALAAGPDGETFSYTTLTEGVRAVLPWVERVVLVADSGVTSMVPMRALVELPGVLSRVPDLEPPMVYPTRFPAELLA